MIQVPITLLQVLETAFLLLIGVQVLYLFIYAVAGIFPYTPALRKGGGKKKNRILVFIPGYREDRIIIDTAQKALQQSYPRDYYDVVVLADSFSEETLSGLRKLDIHVLEVSFDNSTKAKSLNRGLTEFASEGAEIAVVLDADNVMAEDFLEKINCAYNSGFQVIQGHRTAKNQDTDFALLDAINEEIGNTIFRKGHRRLGVSSALIGSAMAFEYKLLKDIMAGIEDVAGEDKLVELKLLRQRHTVEYLGDALVYDEKVSSGAGFAKQRTRWVGAQVYFFKHYFFDGVRQLVLRGNFGYFDKVFQFFLIPKVLLVGLLLGLGVLSAFSLISTWWLYLALVYFLALALAVPRSFYNRRLFTAIAHLPRAIFYMLLGILRIRRSTAVKFEVTEKGTK